MWWVEPVRSEDKKKWAEVKARHNKKGSLWYWTSEGWCCFKSNVKPYTDPINENEDNDDFNVVASDEWNKLGLDDIVTVDFIGRESIGIEALHQFNNVPFKIVDVDIFEWWVEPVKAEDKKKWKEVKMKYNKDGMLSFWTDQGWNTNKENVEPYDGPINEDEDDDDEFTVDASDEWNAQELTVGSQIHVDMFTDEAKSTLTSFSPTLNVNNIVIISKIYNGHFNVKVFDKKGNKIGTSKGLPNEWINPSKAYIN